VANQHWGDTWLTTCKCLSLILTQADSEDVAKAFIGEISREHQKARHIAFAYVMLNTAKTSDDGEPRGTAGLAIYNVITRHKLKNVVVVVVRYFGGTLLGKGGLIRAYGKAAGLTIEGSLQRQ